MVEDVRNWLSGLGLEAYIDAFVENEIDPALLPHLTGDDLTALGVTKLGHRKKLLMAMKDLRTGAAPRGAGRHDARETRTPHAERRQLTVMFVDVVDSTALAGRIDPEDLRDILTGFQNAVAGSVARFDGQVAKYMGDGVLCYFGWPKAHEDDAERAVRAGLDILRVLKKIETTGRERISVRIGVATGLVVVGDLIGEGAAQEEAVVGETPNLAARLQGLASPGTLVVSETTHRLLGATFDVNDLGGRALKGIAAEVRAWEVTGASAVQTRFEAHALGPLRQMVGRDRELDLVLDRWRRAVAGEGQLLLLSGEAGIGKSRILRAVGDAVADQPHVKISYQCSPFHADSALFPAIRQLTFAAQIRDQDSNDERLDKLEMLLVDGGVPVIGELVGLNVEGRYGPLDLTPQEQRARTLRALTDELTALSRDRPVLFVCEDAHWIDPSTLELLDLAVDRIGAERVLMLVTARPGFDHGFGGHPNVTKLALNRLARGEAATIIANIAAERPLPDELVRAIADRTDGVPLYVEEMTKTVLEAAMTGETGTGYGAAESVDRLSVPATLNDSLMARLDRHPSAKEVAQIAACIGRQFDQPLLARIAPMDRDDLQGALDDLCGAELIFRRSAGSNASYSFKHALVSDAAYESLLRSRRREIHGQIADALAAEDGDKEPPELLAHHYAEADRPAEALAAWEQAGNAAQARVALREATHHFRAALVQLARLPEDDACDLSELRILSRLGSAYFNLEGWASTEANKVYERAYELSERTDASAEKVTALAGLWLFRNGRAEHARAAKITRQLFDVARRQDDDELLLQANHAAWPNYALRGLLIPACEAIDRGLAIYDEEKHRHHAHMFMGHDPAVCAHSVGISMNWERGCSDQAAAHAQEAVALSRRIEHIPSSMHALIHICMWYTETGDYKSAMQAAEELSALSEAHQLRAGMYAARTFRGWARVRIGEIEKGLLELEDSVAAWQRTGARLHVPQRLSLLGDAYSLAGRHREALDTFRVSLDMSATTGEVQFESSALMKQGEALLRQGAENGADAEHSFRRAREVAVGQSAIAYELRATVLLSRLLAERGRRADAEGMLRETLSRAPANQKFEEWAVAKSALEEFS